MLLGNTYTIPNIVNLPGQSGGVDYGDDFAFIMQTDAPNETIKLRGNGAPASWYNYEVDWGDGNVETVVNLQTKEHTYADAGDHIIRISGQYGGWRSDNIAYTTRKITEVLNWGKVGFYSFYAMFNDHDRLTKVPDIINYPWEESSLGPVPARGGSVLNYSFYRAFAATSITGGGATASGPKLKRFVLKDTKFESFTDLLRGVLTLEYLEVTGNVHGHINYLSTSSNMFYYAGFQSPEGVDVIFKDNVWTATAGALQRDISLQGCMRRMKIKSLDFSNNDVSSIDSSKELIASYWFNGTEFTTPNMEVPWGMKIGDHRIDFAFACQQILGNPTLIDFTATEVGPSGRINVVDINYFHNQEAVATRNAGFRFIKGLNLWKAASGYPLNAFRFSRYAQELTFPDDDPSKNWASDFMHAGVTSGSNFGNMFQIHGTNYPGETSPNFSDWDTSSVTTINACFYRVFFKENVTLNWDLSNCTTGNQFYAMFFDSEAIGGTDNYIDLRGVTWPNVASSTIQTRQMFQLTEFGKIKMSSFPGGMYYAERMFDNNDDLNEIDWSTIDFSYITTTNDDNSRLTWDRNPQISKANYAILLDRMKTLTQPGLPSSGGMVQDMGVNARWDAGNIYSVRQGAISVPVGSTTITDASATFQTDGVVAGDIYRMQSSSNANISYYIIQSVDSETQLTLAYPTTDSQSFYNIFTTQAAKDYAANMIQNGGKFRVIADGGPIIT